MFERLFDPITVGALHLKNRIIMPAIASNLSMDGRVSQELIDYYVTRAEGGVSMIIALTVCVVDMKVNIVNAEGCSSIDAPSIFDDSFLDDLRRLAEPIKMAGAKAGIQLVHMGSQGLPSSLGSELLAPSPIPCPIYKDIPRELSIDEIRYLVNQFAEAALRARDAGFDIVEFHGAHGYLISEFLSKYSNRREDAYGGSPENMARFACEIISSTRKRMGPDFALGIRINGEDFVPGGTTIEDAKAMAPYLEQSGVDYISVSGGMYGSMPATVPPMMDTRGCFVPMAKEIKKVVTVPVITAGRINNPVLAEEILQKGWADIIGMGRALIADPQLPKKAQKGDVRNIRKCIACNQGCIDKINKTILPGKYDGQDASLTCMVNPRVGKEGVLLIRPADEKKRVLVAGGGPAGMEAARVAAKRGHEVVLMEKSDRLGGQLNLAAKVPFKEEVKEEVDYLSYQMERLGIDVLMGKEANIETIHELAPDIVIVATGCRPISLEINEERDKAVTAWDVLDDKAELGKNVLIVGGASVGLETALFLAVQGKKVTVVEQLKTFAADMGFISRFYVRSKLSELDVTLMKLTKFKDLNDRGAVVEVDGGERLIPMVDNIVWAVGSEPNNSLVEDLKGSRYSVYTIGDAKRPRDALCAIDEAYRLALEI